MKKLEVYARILKDTVSTDANVEDALMSAVVLHTHEISLRPDVALDDLKKAAGQKQLTLAPLTRTHVAEMLAALWPSNAQRGENEFWVEQYGALTPWELFSDVSPAFKARALAAKKRIEAHPLVGALIEE